MPVKNTTNGGMHSADNVLSAGVADTYAVQSIGISSQTFRFNMLNTGYRFLPAGHWLKYPAMDIDIGTPDTNQDDIIGSPVFAVEGASTNREMVALHSKCRLQLRLPTETFFRPKMPGPDANELHQ